MAESNINPKNGSSGGSSIGSTDIGATQPYFPLRPGPDYDVHTPGSDTIISDSPPIELLIGSTDTLLESQQQKQQLYSGGALPVGTMLGHFKVEKFIGGGGMGRVYLALDTALARKVAVKVLPRQRAQDAASVARFMNEARSAARLNHEHIAQVYFAGEQDGTPFIAFEYVEGTNVRTLIESRGVFSLPQAINYIMQITHAIAHASMHSVIHRDVKPSNILITSDNNSQAKLIDMGLARLLKSSGGDGDLTASGVTLGTFDYISPEQARDPRNADIRSDIYSLGCTFFYMLAGRPPFPEGTVLQKLLQHQGDDPPDIRAFQPTIPLEVAQIIQKMMAKDPRQRYQDPNALLDALVVAAEMLGLKPSGSGKIVWLTRTRSKRTIFFKHLPWISTVSLLLILLFGMRAFHPGKVIPPSPPIMPPRPNLAANNNVQQPNTNEASIGTMVPEIAKFDLVYWPPASSGTVSPVVPVNPSALSATASKSIPTKRVRGGIIAKNLSFNSDKFGISRSSIKGEQLTLLNAAGRITSFAPDSVTPRPVETTEQAVLIVDPKRSDRDTNIFPTLESALNAAGKNAIIELRCGLLELRPIQLTDKTVTIKAGKDYTPTLSFQPSRVQSSGSMITISGGKITWDSINFEMDVPTETPTVRWTLFDIPISGSLKMNKCMGTIRNLSRHIEVAFFRNSPVPPGQDVKLWPPFYEHPLLRGLSDITSIPNPESTGSNSLNVTVKTPETGSGDELLTERKPADPEVLNIQISDSFFRGEASLISCESTSVGMKLDNVAIASSLPVFVSKELKLATFPEPVVNLKLNHVTVYSRSILVRQVKDPESSGKVMSIKVDAENSVFNLNKKSLVASSSFASLEEALQRFTWASKSVNYFENVDTCWWKIQYPDISSEKWAETWGTTQISDKVMAEIPETKAVSAIIPSELTVLPSSKAYRSCQGSPDNIDAGAQIDRLPKILDIY